MNRQKQELRIGEANPPEPGGQEEGSQPPKGDSFERVSGDGAGKKRANPRFQSVSEMSVRKLKRLHGESQGRNQAVEEELRARGFNSQMLEAAAGTKTPSVTQACRCTWWLSAEPKRCRKEMPPSRGRAAIGL